MRCLATTPEHARTPIYSNVRLPGKKPRNHKSEIGDVTDFTKALSLSCGLLEDDVLSLSKSVTSVPQQLLYCNSVRVLHLEHRQAMIENFQSDLQPEGVVVQRYVLMPGFGVRLSLP